MIHVIGVFVFLQIDAEARKSFKSLSIETVLWRSQPNLLLHALGQVF